MRFEGLDLNLLVVLDALLQEQNVSSAAERLHLSQSGTSSALARLREYFEDELLVSAGRSLEPTPRALELAEPVRAILDQVRSTVIKTEAFDPATSDRNLTIMAIDVVSDVFLAGAMAVFAREAPSMRFEIAPISEDPMGALQRGRADIIIGLDYILSSDYPNEFLYEESFMVIGWERNPAFLEPLTLERYARLGHVSVRFHREIPGFEESTLRRLGIRRQIELIAPSFASIGKFLVGTDRIATVHRRLALHMADILPIRAVEIPFEFPRVREVMQWLPRNSDDAAIAWVVRRLKQLAAEAER